MLVAMLISACVLAQNSERAISFAIDINAPIDTVWSRWASPSGIRKFFAPVSTLELKTLGRLDVLFAPSAPVGQRGAENNVILAFQEKQMISFSWDAPPTFPEIRKQRTTVIVRFSSQGPNKTQVTLTQLGFGSGSEWDAVYAYFAPAWGGFVLPNLKYSCEVAPVDWTDFPKNAPKGLAPAKRL